MSDSGAYRAFEYLLELEKEESLKSDLITRLEYDVGPWTPRLHYTVEVDIETEVQKASVIRKGNNYPIHDDTYFIEIMFYSNRLTFIENKRVFYNFCESFEWGEHLMKPTAE
jgi:hypothetical protein